MLMRLMPLAALLAASTAGAETLRIVNYYPAYSDELAELRELQVETIGGEGGPALTMQIEDQLRAIDLGQGPWFRVIPASIGSDRSDAVLRGTVHVDPDISDYTEQRERCIKNDAGKCTDAREKYTVRCIRRNFDMQANLRLIRRDGVLVWSNAPSEEYDDSRCEDSSDQFRPFHTVLQQLAGRIAQGIRKDLAPRREEADIRVDEGRKGLASEDAAAFKAAVRLVKDGRPEEACTAWNALSARYGEHVPTQFNIGLCEEFLGHDDAAREKYRQVQQLSPRYGAAKAGLERIDLRRQALAQLQMRTSG